MTLQIFYRKFTKYIKQKETKPEKPSALLKKH